MIDAFELLSTQYGYSTNIINAKITAPSDINYRYLSLSLFTIPSSSSSLLMSSFPSSFLLLISDDELMFMNYFTFLYAGGNKFAASEFDVSLERSWSIAKVSLLPLSLPPSLPLALSSFVYFFLLLCTAGEV